MIQNNKASFIHHVRPIGWGLTLFSLVPASAWALHPLWLPGENYTALWFLIFCVVAISATILALSVKSKSHDLIIAGILTFYSPLLIFFIVPPLASLFY